MALSVANTHPVGTTELRLPELGFGAAHIAGRSDRIDGATARNTLQAAWDCGLRYFDTAPFYGRGLSEHRTGDFLTDQPREDFILTTKVGRVFRRPSNPGSFDLTPWKAGLRFEYQFDYSYDGVMRSYEDSLMRLGMDSVEALLIHDPDAVAHGEHWESRMKDMSTTGIKALEELKRAGDIKAIGMGLNTTESLDIIPQMVDLDFLIVAMPYTLLDQSALPSLDRFGKTGISVVIGAPFASGILVTGPIRGALYRYQAADEITQKKTRAIQAICAHYGVSLAAAALQFPLGHYAVISIIPGGANPAEVRANVATFDIDIPAALWADLKEQELISPQAPTPA